MIWLDLNSSDFCMSKLLKTITQMTRDLSDAFSSFRNVLGLGRVNHCNLSLTRNHGIAPRTQRTFHVMKLHAPNRTNHVNIT